IRDTEEQPDIVLIATGSEVSVALEAADLLDKDEVRARVVSMPWRERFMELPRERADELLPPGVPRVVVEAAYPQGWEGLAGADGRIVGINRFGASAAGSEVLEKLGFSGENVAAAARDVLSLEPADT
ncbi:MAG: transketolase, partial [Actinomycetota bacterium]|nr:transketolase [Actinomycetota bacterium]